MKRKWLVLLLALNLMGAVCLSGCGDSTPNRSAEEAVEDDAEDDSDEAVDNDAEEEKEDKETSRNKTGEKESKSESVLKKIEKKNEEDRKEDEDKEEGIKAERGVISDGMFVNEVFGIAFPVDDTMMVLSDEQILDAMGVGADVLLDEEMATPKQMEKAMQGSIYDTMIIFEDNTTNAIVCYENLDITANGICLNEEQYKKVLVNSMTQMSTLQYEVVDESSVELGGEEFLRIDMKAQMEGEEIQQIYCLRQQENYMVSIIISCRGDKQIGEDFLSTFVDASTVTPD